MFVHYPWILRFVCGRCYNKTTFCAARSYPLGHFFGDFFGGRFWTSFVVVSSDFWYPSGHPFRDFRIPDLLKGVTEVINPLRNFGG